MTSRLRSGPTLALIAVAFAFGVGSSRGPAGQGGPPAALQAAGPVFDVYAVRYATSPGFAISSPRPVRQEVFQGAEAKVQGESQPSPSPALPPAPAPSAPEPPARVPFRSVLRRASA